METLFYFKYEHLPAYLAQVSQPFAELAHYVANNLPKNGQTEMALQKLLEAKDCAVRARVFDMEQQKQRKAALTPPTAPEPT